MSILAVEQLTHHYGDKLILDNVSFRMLKGEHIGLVGANGAGKSTLFRIITEQLLPDSGKITWHPAAKKESLEQHIQLHAGEKIRTYLQSAFQELFTAEQEMVTLTEQMSSASNDQLDYLLKQYSQLQNKLEQHGFYSLDAKIEEVAAGLGLTSLGMETDVTELSGGQRTKLLLARLLLTEPDVLLLDEPTNYLDTAHINWLENYLKTYPHAFILISHDTMFMNGVVSIIYHLEHRTLTRYKGNYQSFLAAYELRKHQIHEQYERQQQEIQKLESYVQKNKARASTAKQAKSREKKLKRMTRIEKPNTLPQPSFSFSVCAQPVNRILEASDLDIGYNHALFSAVNLKLNRGEKVALIGHNGIGKTTTLKTLLGELTTLGGTISMGERVKPAYFSQEAQFTGKQTALQYIWSLFPELTQKEVRTKLARCGLTAEHIFQPLISLSGGEQTKVRLCELQLAASNLLVLDEPTNHLDPITKEALAKALQEYQGTIILVSHEAAFYQDWVTQVWDMELWT